MHGGLARSRPHLNLLPVVAVAGSLTLIQRDNLHTHTPTHIHATNPAMTRGGVGCWVVCSGEGRRAAPSASSAHLHLTEAHGVEHGLLALGGALACEDDGHGARRRGRRDVQVQVDLWWGETVGAYLWSGHLGPRMLVLAGQ
jgi:hypothetical protein